MGIIKIDNAGEKIKKTNYCDSEKNGENSLKITPENFHFFIKRIRRCNGWSTTQLAEKLNVSNRTIEGWEQGRATPKPLIPIINLILEANRKK